MNGYSQEFIEKQRLFLEKEKQKLEKDLKVTNKFPQYGDSEDDNTEEVEDFYTAKGQVNELQILLDDVNKALEKIKQGEYGYCENCGKKKLIEKARLEAFPAATSCIKCENSKK